MRVWIQLTWKPAQLQLPPRSSFRLLMISLCFVRQSRTGLTILEVKHTHPTQMDLSNWRKIESMCSTLSSICQVSANVPQRACGSCSLVRSVPVSHSVWCPWYIPAGQGQCPMTPVCLTYTNSQSHRESLLGVTFTPLHGLQTSQTHFLLLTVNCVRVIYQHYAIRFSGPIGILCNCIAIRCMNLLRTGQLWLSYFWMNANSAMQSLFRCHKTV